MLKILPNYNYNLQFDLFINQSAVFPLTVFHMEELFRQMGSWTNLIRLGQIDTFIHINNIELKTLASALHNIEVIDFQDEPTTEQHFAILKDKKEKSRLRTVNIHSKKTVYHL